MVQRLHQQPKRHKQSVTGDMAISAVSWGSHALLQD
jgi:hypothetical protein